jgi:hypothetical protein
MDDLHNDLIINSQFYFFIPAPEHPDYKVPDITRLIKTPMVNAKDNTLRIAVKRRREEDHEKRRQTDMEIYATRGVYEWFRDNFRGRVVQCMSGSGYEWNRGRER